MKVVFAISKMAGGGAEHVIMQLANHFHDSGVETEVLITNQKSSESDKNGLKDEIPCTFIQDGVQGRKHGIKEKLIHAACRIFARMKMAIPDALVRDSFLSIYGEHVDAVRKYLQDKKGWTTVVFLQPANQIILMANETVGNPVVISERADPNRYFATRYAPFFLKRYYPLVDAAVFQTPDAMACYPQAVQAKGCVIVNPIPDSLPQAFDGVRKKRIVNFCRLSKQKNLSLLIDAFDLFIQGHRDYQLEIIGNGELKAEIQDYITQKGLTDSVVLRSHCADVHKEILDYAMFVSSSDYEGMSNSMLEAMAIGLPTICTDCPIGGAACIIQDHMNGILTPVGDAQALAAAMAEVADDAELAERLSVNGRHIRETQSIEAIGAQWRRVIEEIEGR